jgi:hypothetical protein
VRQVVEGEVVQIAAVPGQEPHILAPLWCVADARSNHRQNSLCLIVCASLYGFQRSYDAGFRDRWADTDHHKDSIGKGAERGPYLLNDKPPIARGLSQWFGC